MGGDYSYRRKYKSTVHLRFDEVKDTGKTKVWKVVSTHANADLGEIKWYYAWRRYVFYPDEDTLYDSRCLTIIINFINSEMEARKKSKKKKK